MKFARYIVTQAVIRSLTGVCIATIALFSIYQVFADNRLDSTPAFKPAVNAMLDVITSQGNPRIYATGTGLTLWSSGSSLPVYKGDRIKMVVFVSTGAYELQQVDIKLDDNPPFPISRGPWETTFDTSAMDAGFHMFRITARSDGPEPYASGEQDIAVYVAQPIGEPESAPANSAAMFLSGERPTQEVAPAIIRSQVMSDVMTIGVTASPARGAARLYPLPHWISASSREAASAIVNLKVGASEPYVGDSAAVITLTRPTIVTVGVPIGSTASRFGYAIYRDGEIVYQSDHLMAVPGSKIKIQARSALQPGLLPGHVVLRAWGVDRNGCCGPDTSAMVSIPDYSEESVK